MEMMKDKNLEERERMDLLKLISEYKEFKRAHVQHFRFNSEASTSMFGKKVISNILFLNIQYTYIYF